MVYFFTKILCSSWLFVFLLLSLEKSVIAQPLLPNPDKNISPIQPRLRELFPDVPRDPSESSPPIKREGETPPPSEESDIPEKPFFVRDIKIISELESDEAKNLKLIDESRDCVDLFLMDKDFLELENYILKSGEEKDTLNPESSILQSDFIKCKPRSNTGNLKGREVTLQELLNLRTILSKLYINNGYVTSAAFIPTNQDVSQGTVKIQVIEGGIDIEKVDIRGLKRLKKYYILDRIARDIDKPLKITDLEAALQLLQGDPLLKSVEAELSGGSKPGESILTLDVTEADPFSVNLGIDNYRDPSIGTLQGNISATHLNVLGFGDRLSLGYSKTDGLDLYQVSSSIPFNGLNGTIELGYSRSDSLITDSRFREAGIRGDSETFAFNIRQPLRRSPTNEFALSLGFDLRQSRTFILDDIPFSFSLGPEDGVSKVRALRFSQEWLNKDKNTVLGARSQFSLGLDILDATSNNSGTDGQFFAWLGQFQWIQQIATNTLLITQINAQLTPDSLLPLERISLGGVDTVRGYPQNQIVADNGINASAELRVPVIDKLQLVPFVDAGTGWNNQAIDPDPSVLLGLGLGLRWEPSDFLTLRVDYGIPLISSGDDGNSLQESGFYFSADFQPF